MYYKSMNEGQIVSIQTSEIPIETSDNFIEITKEEYNSISLEFEQKAQAEDEAIQQEEQSYISQLEAENAALLFQILTGEEFADV